MKITNKATPTGNSKTGSMIPIGTTFSGEIGAYPDRTFLRTHSGIVSLENPNSTWSSASEVTNYRKLNAELVIHGYAD